MAVKFTMKSTRELLKARGLMAGDTAQKFVDGEVLRRCAPMVPFDSGAPACEAAYTNTATMAASTTMTAASTAAKRPSTAPNADAAPVI